MPVTETELLGLLETATGIREQRLVHWSARQPELSETALPVLMRSVRISDCDQMAKDSIYTLLAADPRRDRYLVEICACVAGEADPIGRGWLRNIAAMAIRNAPAARYVAEHLALQDADENNFPLVSKMLRYLGEGILPRFTGYFSSMPGRVQHIRRFQAIENPMIEAWLGRTAQNQPNKRIRLAAAEALARRSTK